MSSVNLYTNSSSAFVSPSSKNETNTNEKFEVFKEEDYDTTLQKALDKLSDLEKEAHLKTLEELEEQGFSKEQLNMLNLYVISKKDNEFSKDDFSKEDIQTIDSYERIFDKVYEVIKEKREERLALKPLQAQTMMNDTILKAYDAKEGKSSLEHSINLEV